MTTDESSLPGRPVRLADRISAVVKSNPLLVFAVLFSALWLLLDLVLLAPRFGGEDIYYFKDPGANFAQHLGFVSRFTFGNPTFQYATYSQYPPVYPFIFGLYAKIFGVSLVSNQVFNTLVGLLAGVSGYYVLRPALAALGARWSVLAAGLVFAVSVAFSFFQPETDRPDAMAVAMGLWALVLIRSGLNTPRAIAAGAICAATFFVSPFVAIWTSIVAAILVAAWEGSLKQIVRVGAWAVLGAVGAGILALAVIAVILPGWLAHFSGVFTGATTHNETGGGYFTALLHGDLRGWLAGFSNIKLTLPSLLTLVIAELGLLAAVCWNWVQARRGDVPWSGLWVAALVVVSPACLIIAPYQSNYMRLTAAMLLAGAACLTLLMPARAKPGYAIAIVAAFLCLNLMSAPELIREDLIRTTTRASLQRAKLYIDSHRADFDKPGSYFAVAPVTYMLWRQEGLRPLTITYSGFKAPEDRARLASLALTYIGSGDPEKPAAPDWPISDEFAPTWTPQLPQRPRLLKLPLSRGSQTWESAIYSRQAK